MKKRNWLRNLALLGVCGCACFGLGRLYYNLTDDFRLGNITCDFGYREDWDTGILADREKLSVESILSQPFTYLGKGSQSYAFVSSDDRYVLKFFKFKHLRPSPIVGILPSISPFNDYKQMDQIRKHRKFCNVFSGYKLAHDLHKQESGIVYVHLNQTLGLWPEIKVKDKLGFNRKIDLDRVIFVIQDKAVKTRDVMTSHLANGDVEQAKQAIRQIFDLYYKEYAKGLYDRDHGVMHNTGFVGDHPIHLDVGMFCREEKMLNPKNSVKDMITIASKFSEWIKSNYPQSHREIVQEMERKISELYGESISLTETFIGS